MFKTGYSSCCEAEYLIAAAEYAVLNKRDEHRNNTGKTVKSQIAVIWPGNSGHSTTIVDE